MLLKTWSRSILVTLCLALPCLSGAQMSLEISVGFPPPELPVYEQPPIPGEGYIWTPGFWAWGDDIEDYYWVPGTWVLAPQPEYLWTPGYWAADREAYYWHPGYWGPAVGFYGGVNYGYGYGGRGYEGGYWREGRMYYNRSVNNIRDTNITNVYNRTVVNNVNTPRVSYNGGNGGVRARPSPSDQAAEHERHIAVTPMQTQHLQAARSNPELRASQNRGTPPIAATPRPAAFTSPGVVQASRGNASSVVHANPQPRDAQPANRAAQPPQNRAPSTEYRTAQPDNRAPQQQYQPRQQQERQQQERQQQQQQQQQQQYQQRQQQQQYQQRQQQEQQQQRAARPPAPEAPPRPQQQQMTEQRRAPEQPPPARQYQPQQPPRQAAPPPPPPPPRQAAPPPPRAQPQPPPRPAEERGPAHNDERERH